MTTARIQGGYGQENPIQAPILLTLTQQERRDMAKAGSEMTASPLHHPDWACRQAVALRGKVPPRLVDALTRFADLGSVSGTVVLRGLEVGQVPNTPLNNEHGEGMSSGLAAQMMILSHLVGEMIKYQAEGHGFLLQDMVPNPLRQDEQESQGSRAELEEHTEQAFSSSRPDYVALGCLRGDPDARTYAFRAKDVVQSLTPAEVEMLRLPLWATSIDRSFKPFMKHPDQVRGPWPIISGPVDDPTILIDQDLMIGISKPAQDLLVKVHNLYMENRNHHVLQVGDILFLDNLRAMHGRSSFRAKFDGSDRFVLRGFIVRDRRRYGAALGSDHRTVLARFS